MSENTNMKRTGNGKGTILQEPKETLLAETKKGKTPATATQSTASPSSMAMGTATKRTGNTRVIVHCNTGFGNMLFLRGDGAGLNWEKGVALRNINEDTWVWETERPFTQCSFKVMLNDNRYEQGENHPLVCHEQVECYPTF